MKYMLLTDTHFGAKNSSMSWWSSMCSFIYNLFILDLENLNEKVNIIHLGDVFDSRSTINTYIANGVRKMFMDLASVGNVENIYVIGGNHDYYSPENNDHCSLDLVLNNIPKVHLITHEPLYIDNIALLPWGCDYNDVKKRTKYVFAHTDIITGNPKLNIPVFSGHIHIPYIRDNVRNLGSCYPLTFMDANRARYYYLWDSETDKLQEFPNTSSIRFWRVHDISEINDRMRPHDYVELYLKSKDIAANQEKIQELNRQFKNFWLIPVPEQIEGDVEVGCDINSIIESSIPDNLRDVFIKIKEKIVI